MAETIASHPSFDQVLSRVVAVYANVLETSDINPDLDVFTLGADSVQAIQIALELELQFEISRPIEEYEEESRPRAVAEWLYSRLRSDHEG